MRPRGATTVLLLMALGFACGRSVTYGGLPSFGAFDAGVPAQSDGAVSQATEQDGGCLADKDSIEHPGTLVPDVHVDLTSAPGVRATTAFDWNTLVFEGQAQTAGTLSLTFGCWRVQVDVAAGAGPDVVVATFAANLPPGYVAHTVDVSGGGSPAWSIQIDHAP